MAILRSHGYGIELDREDWRENAAWAVSSTVINYEAGPYGLRCLRARMPSPQNALLTRMPTDLSSLTMSFWWRYEGTLGTNSGTRHMAMVGPDDSQLSFALANNTTPRIWLFSGATLEVEEQMALKAVPFQEGRWYWASWAVNVVNDDDVETKLHINGVEIYDGLMTNPFASGDGIRWAGLFPTFGGTAGTTRFFSLSTLTFEDVFTPRLKPLFAQVLRPETQGFHDEWTPAAAVADVNNAVPSGNVIEGVEGERTTYEVDNLPLVPGSKDILSIFAGGFGSTVGDEVRGYVRRGSSDGEGAAFADLESTPRFRHAPMPVDPITAAAWDPDDLATTEFGLIARTP